MAKTYTLTATSINGGRKSSYESDWRNYSANENKDAGRRNDDYKATNILFNATTLASLRSKPILSIKLKLTITHGTIYTSDSYARQLIGYKLNSTTTTSSDGSAWTRSDANSTAASGTVYAGQILADTETTITTATQVTFDLTGSSVPVYGYVIGPSRSSLSSYSYITISDATLEVITNEYDITYHANGGSGAPRAQVKTHDVALTLTSDRPIRSNVTSTYTVTYNANSGSVSPTSATATKTTTYTFSKWNTAANGSGTDYAPGGTYTANAAATLYAQWATNTSTTSVTLPTPTRAGYTFNGWYTAASGGTRVGGGGSSYTPTASITLYAQWTINTYTVSYNKGANGTGTNTSDTKTYGSTLTLKGAIFTRTGYTQTGWSTSDGGSKAYNLSGSYTANAAATLYPFWTINTYAVSYNANGGSGAPSAQTKTYNVTLTLSSTIPTRTGYTFLGWSTSSTATSATYSAGGSYTANAAATLYAVWQIITYTVSYNKGANGTGTNSTATKTYNVALTLKGAQFTRTGYTQTGWATSDGGSQAYTLGGSYTANAAITLYPVWTAGKSTVSTTNGTLGTAQTITITRYNTSFTHTLSYKYGNATGTIATGVGTSYSWTPPTSLAAQFPAATSGVCTITCTTYSGSTNIGSSTTTCTLSIPSSVKCTVGTVTVTEAVAGLASKFGAFIQGKSRATISATINSGSGSPAYGATVSAYAITTNGQTLTSNGATTGILNTSGSNSYSFKITDTRGYSDTKSSTYNVLAYSSPTISASISRNASDASKIDVSYSYTISSCNNRNDKSLSVKYRVVGGSYTTIAITASSYSGNGTYQITGLDANTAYEVVVTVTDYFTSASATTNIQPTGNRVFDISDDDKTIARHGTNYSDGWDHQYFNERFHGVVDITPRRCEATLSGAGWYRAIVYNSYSTGSAQGTSGEIVTIKIVYTSQVSVQHEISLWMSYGKVAFLGETSHGTTNLVDKIRYTYAGAVGYVDIHITSLSSVYYNVSFDVASRIYAKGEWVAGTLASVDASPSGETVLAEYTFAANATPLHFILTTTPILVTDYGTTKFTVDAIYYDLGNIGIAFLNPGTSVLQGVSFSTLLELESLPFQPISASGYVRSLGSNQDGMDTWQVAPSTHSVFLRKRGGGNLVGTFGTNPLLQVTIIGVK